MNLFSWNGITIKIEYLEGLLAVYDNFFKCDNDYFTKKDFKKFWENQEIQEWYSGLIPIDPQSNKYISLKESFDLFVLAYKNNLSIMCEEMIRKNENLKNFLEGQNFTFPSTLSNNLQYRGIEIEKLEHMEALEF